MEEKKYAVLLTDNQEIKILECDPQEEIFEIARGSLGCEWIELVEPDALSKNGYLLLIDEEGKLKDGPMPINCIASDMYGSDRHGDPIVGNAMIVRAGDERLMLLTKAEAEMLSSDLDALRDMSIERFQEHSVFSLCPQPRAKSWMPPGDRVAGKSEWSDNQDDG